MYNQITMTFQFKELLQDVNIFLNCVAKYTNLDITDVYHTTLYRRLYSRYANSQICYDSVEAFYNNFFITYENTYRQYKMRASVLEKIYTLDTNELITAGITISNLALNNNEVTKEPLNNIIEYVSEQTSSKITGDIFKKLLTVVNTLEDEYIEEYLNKFTKHFVTIYYNDIVLYK